MIKMFYSNFCYYIRVNFFVFRHLFYYELMKINHLTFISALIEENEDDDELSDWETGKKPLSCSQTKHIF